MLWKLKELIPIEDICAYADDILILCNNLETLEKCMETIEKWSEENNMKINKSKSAIMEFIHRQKRKRNLVVGQKFKDYPIVDQYKYLGTWLNSKLTHETHLRQVINKTYTIRRKLSPMIYSISLEMRKNLWQIFIMPLYEFILPIYHQEQATTKRNKMELALRNSFKSFTGLKKGMQTKLIQDLMDYDLNERSKYLYDISQKRWKTRARKEIQNVGNEVGNIKSSQENPQNLCKYMPKSMIKYLNMLTSLCPKCKDKHRCSPEHLLKYHKIKIMTAYDVSEDILKYQKARKSKKMKLTRADILNYVNNLIQPNLDKLKEVLNSK